MDLFKKISNRVLFDNENLFCALKKMDDNGVKLLLIFSADSKFLGLLSIGDIQRAIIGKNDLTSSVSDFVRKSIIHARLSSQIDDIKRKMLEFRCECMPVLDDSDDLVDVIFWEDIFPKKSLNESRKINIPLVIMAGGEGTRLKPITNVIPKPLVPIGEKTIVELIINQFDEIGCSKVYMSVNYKSEIIEYYLKNLNKNYDVHFFKEDKPLGTIGSVRLLENEIKTPFFVSNCDIIIEQDFCDVYDYHIDNKNDITVVTAVKSYQIPYGVIDAGENGILNSISEKPDMTYMINTGVYILESKLIAEIPCDTVFHMTHLIEKVRKQGGRIGCFPVSEKSWIDIGDWSEYLKLINR